MEYKYTRHQIPRGTKPDAETYDKLYLLKNVSTLRATYQVRMLTFLAMEKGKKLEILVPKHFKAHPSLRDYMKENRKLIKIVKE
jgi:hypothetical protein